MDAVLQSLMAGLPVLMAHSALTFVLLGVGVAVYMKITPYDDLALVRDGNQAAALSLFGIIVGLALPLAVCMASSVSIYDILIWGIVTIALQLIAYRISDLIIKDLPARIEAGDMAAAIVVLGIKLATAFVNAAAISG